MGGNNSKNNDFLDYLQNQNIYHQSVTSLSNKKASYNQYQGSSSHQTLDHQHSSIDSRQKQQFDLYKPHLRQSKSSQNLNQHRHYSSKQNQNQALNYQSTATLYFDEADSDGEESHKKKQPQSIINNRVNQVTKMTMSKRQQFQNFQVTSNNTSNIMEQLEQRLQKNQSQKGGVILCKTPSSPSFHSQIANNHINNVEGSATKQQLIFNNENLTTPMQMQRNLSQMSILSTGDSKIQLSEQQLQRQQLPVTNKVEEEFSFTNQQLYGQVVNQNDKERITDNLNNPKVIKQSVGSIKSVREELEEELRRISQRQFHVQMNSSSSQSKRPGLISQSALGNYSGGGKVINSKSLIRSSIKSLKRSSNGTNSIKDDINSNGAFTNNNTIDSSKQAIQQNKLTTNSSNLKNLKNFNKHQLPYPSIKDNQFASNNNSLMNPSSSQRQLSNHQKPLAKKASVVKLLRKDSPNSHSQLLRSYLQNTSFTNNANNSQSTTSSLTFGLQTLLQYTESQNKQQQKIIPPWQVKEHDQESSAQKQINDIRQKKEENNFKQKDQESNENIQDEMGTSGTNAHSNGNFSEFILSKNNLTSDLKFNQTALSSVNQIDPHIVSNFLNQTPQSSNRMQKEFSLPSEVVLLLLQYNMEDYLKYMRLSASWYCSIVKTLDNYTQNLERGFIQKYQKQLRFIRAYNSATPIDFCSQKGLRIDRIFQCEVVAAGNVGQTFKFGYNFLYHQANKSSVNKLQRMNSTHTRYTNEYRFDYLKPGTQRVTWLHHSDDMPAYSQNEIQLQQGDYLEFAVSLFNLNGLIDLSSLRWDSPEYLPIQPNERTPLAYNKDFNNLRNSHIKNTKDKRKHQKVLCNTNRICEVEDAVVEWIPLTKLTVPRLPITFDSQSQQLFQQQKTSSSSQLSTNTQLMFNFFDIISVHFNELDLHFNRIILQAKKVGIYQWQDINDNNQQSSKKIIQIVIKNKAGVGSKLVNEIKKRGVMFDRNKEIERIEIRVGDILVIYNSRRIPRELQPEIMFESDEYASKQSNSNGEDDDNQEEEEPTNNSSQKGDYHYKDINN